LDVERLLKLTDQHDRRKRIPVRNRVLRRIVRDGAYVDLEYPGNDLRELVWRGYGDPPRMKIQSGAFLRVGKINW
jgi:hypothetical protein